MRKAILTALLMGWAGLAWALPPGPYIAPYYDQVPPASSVTTDACANVTSVSAVKIIAGSTTRRAYWCYTSQNVNCNHGTIGDIANATAPVSGTPASPNVVFPLLASNPAYVESRAPGVRLDCIAQSTTAVMCCEEAF